jgi:hypothetical protein
MKKFQKEQAEKVDKLVTTFFGIIKVTSVDKAAHYLDNAIAIEEKECSVKDILKIDNSLEKLKHNGGSSIDVFMELPESYQTILFEKQLSEIAPSLDKGKLLKELKLEDTLSEDFNTLAEVFYCMIGANAPVA